MVTTMKRTDVRKVYRITTSKNGKTETDNFDWHKGMMPMTIFVRLLLRDELLKIDWVSYRRIK